MGLRELRVTDIGTVNLKLDLTIGESDRRIFASRDELDGVVVVELLNSRLRGDRHLGLCDEHVLGGTRHCGPFVSVEVNELRVHFKVRLGECSTTPRDAELDIMVLERHERQRGLSIFTERESEWVELRRICTVTRRRERLGVRLRKHDRRDVLRKFRSVRVDDLTTDQKFNLFDLSLPLGAGQSLGCAVGNVHVTNEITLTLEAHS